MAIKPILTNGSNLTSINESSFSVMDFSFPNNFNGYIQTDILSLSSVQINMDPLATKALGALKTKVLNGELNPSPSGDDGDNGSGQGADQNN